MKKYIEDVLHQLQKAGCVKVNNNQRYQIYKKGNIQVEIDLWNNWFEFKEIR